MTVPPHTPVHQNAGGTVRVLPTNIEIEVLEGETLMAAARRVGLRWPSICDGQGSCTVCYVKVEEGMEAASAQYGWERERLDFAGRRGAVFRLACQLKVSGPMVITKRGITQSQDPGKQRIE